LISYPTFLPFAPGLPRYVSEIAAAFVGTSFNTHICCFDELWLGRCFRLPSHCLLPLFPFVLRSPGRPFPPPSTTNPPTPKTKTELDWASFPSTLVWMFCCFYRLLIPVSYRSCMGYHRKKIRGNHRFPPLPPAKMFFSLLASRAASFLLSPSVLETRQLELSEVLFPSVSKPEFRSLLCH